MEYPNLRARNENNTSIPSRDIADQRIQLFDEPRAFQVLASEKKVHTVT